METTDIPDDFPVRPLKRGVTDSSYIKVLLTCGTCDLSWDDDIPTSYTPAPSGRCPFEAFHEDPEQPTITMTVTFNFKPDGSVQVLTDGSDMGTYPSASQAGSMLGLEYLHRLVQMDVAKHSVSIDVLD